MDKYGLIGYPLGHSFSKDFFNEKFQNEGFDAVYENFELASINDLREVLASQPNLRGLNVTIPYKQQVIPLLDELSNEARAIGAVNVIKVERRGEELCLKGYNSDVIGFTRSLRPMLEVHHTHALILGTGGAAKAVAFALQQLHIDFLNVSRQVRQGCLTYDQVTPEVVQKRNVIINCTPCGMYPHVDESPALPYDAMDDKTLLYDLIYNPDETLFMRKGRMRGATVKNGLEMLLLQAIASWQIWQNKMQ